MAEAEGGDDFVVGNVPNDDNAQGLSAQLQVLKQVQDYLLKLNAEQGNHFCDELHKVAREFSQKMERKIARGGKHLRQLCDDTAEVQKSFEDEEEEGDDTAASLPDEAETEQEPSIAQSHASLPERQVDAGTQVVVADTQKHDNPCHIVFNRRSGKRHYPQQSPSRGNHGASVT